MCSIIYHLFFEDLYKKYKHSLVAVRRDCVRVANCQHGPGRQSCLPGSRLNQDEHWLADSLHSDTRCTTLSDNERETRLKAESVRVTPHHHGSAQVRWDVGSGKVNISPPAVPTILKENLNQSGTITQRRKFLESPDALFYVEG